MRKIYLLVHNPRSSYGSSAKVLRAFDDEAAAKDLVDLVGELITIGSLEVVPVDFVPQAPRSILIDILRTMDVPKGHVDEEEPDPDFAEVETPPNMVPDEMMQAPFNESANA